MEDIRVITTSPARDASIKAVMEAANHTTAFSAAKSASNTQPPRQSPPNMHTHTLASSATAPAAENEADSPSPRLLDSDPSKYRSLKRVIVIGRPGSGTDGVSDALKKLGFKVYDFKAASSRYERDFPLWLEAARLHQEGRPYNKSDYDKVIGDHDAVVGAPACFFDFAFVKLYPNVKVILVTRESDLQSVQTFLKKITSKFWQRFNPLYYGHLNQFLMFSAKSNSSLCANNDRVIRETVREKNLLEIHNLIAWVPLCEFLGVQVPNGPAPELHNNTTKAELAARPQLAILEKARKAGRQTILGLTYVFTMASLILISALAAVLGGIGLYQLSFAGLHLVHFLAVRSQIRDTTRLAAAGLALLTFVCGIGAGYSIALMRIPEATVYKPPTRDYQGRDKTGRRRGGKGRDRRSENDENKRPGRPTLDEWNGVQENIRRDDAEMNKEGRATFEERKGKHVTFHVTHKQTEGGQDLLSGPRKVLSVTEETVE